MALHAPQEHAAPVERRPPPPVVDEGPPPMEPVDLDLLQTMLNTEHTYMPNPAYMTGVQNAGVDYHLRQVGIEWLLEVTETYKLHRETCFLAVNYMDRFLSQVILKRIHLPLLAGACVCLAAKLREAEDRLGFWNIIRLVNLSPNKLRHMEKTVLETLGWKLNATSPHTYVEQLMSLLKVKREYAPQIRKHTEFFIDMTIYDHQFMGERPSVVAQAALMATFRSAAKMSNEGHVAMLREKMLAATRQDGEMVDRLTERLLVEFRTIYNNADKHREKEPVDTPVDKEIRGLSDSPEFVGGASSAFAPVTRPVRNDPMEVLH